MTQQPNFTALSVPLSRSSPNLAPSKPIADAIRNKKLNKNPTKFEAAFREWHQSKINYEKVSRDEAISMGQLVALMINGDQLLRRRPFGPGYYVQPLMGDDTYQQKAINVLRFYYQCCETKFTSANPTVTMRPGGDEPIDIASAQAARPVVDYRESQFYTSKFSRRECLYGATNGMFIHRVRWNPFKGEWMAQSRSVSQQSVQSDDGWGECAECQHQDVASEFPETQFGDQCPNCQSAAVDVRRPQTQMMPQVSIGAPRPIGEPEIIQTPFAGWYWDMAKDLEESSWAIYCQRVSSGAISLMLGDLALPDTGSSDNKGLDVLHALAYGGQAFAGTAGTSQRQSNDRRPTMSEAWVPPEEYADWDIEEGETVCGMRMPGGKMRDSFKDPVCVISMNDASLIVGTFANETHQDEVVTGQWFMKSDSGGGRGLQDTAAVNKRLNAVDGQVYQGLAGTATPAIMVDRSILRDDAQSDYLFKPNTTIDVNLNLLPPGLGLKDAFALGTPGNVNQQYIQYGSVYLKDMLQVTSLVTEFSDFMSIDNRTATGAQITSALANSLFGPLLLTKGEARVRIAKIIVRLEVRYGSQSRYFPGKDGARGRNVSGQDLRGKVIYELDQNSELPVTPFSKQADIRALIESMGGIEGLLMLKTQDPAMFRSFVAPYNVKIESESDDVISTICLDMVDQMKANLQAGVDDPVMLTERLNPPVSLYEPKQQEKSQWFSDWLDLDTSRKAPLVLRQAVEQMVLKYQNLKTEREMPIAVNKGLVEGAGMAAAQAPSALGQQALQGGGDPGQAAQQQHEAQQQDADRAMEHDHHAADQEHEMQKASLQARTAITVAEIQGKTAVETTKLAGDNAVRTAKAKPKPTATKAA